MYIVPDILFLYKIQLYIVARYQTFYSCIIATSAKPSRVPNYSMYMTSELQGCTTVPVTSSERPLALLPMRTNQVKSRRLFISQKVSEINQCEQTLHKPKTVCSAFIPRANWHSAHVAAMIRKSYACKVIKYSMCPGMLFFVFNGHLEHVWSLHEVLTLSVNHSLIDRPFLFVLIFTWPLRDVIGMKISARV